MTQLAYANKILNELRPGKIAISVAKGKDLECLITCSDGSIERVLGYWAVEIMNRPLNSS